MSTLRLLSLAFGVTIFAFLVLLARSSRLRVSNGQKLFSGGVALVLLVLGIDPNALNGLLGLMSFEPGHSGRIIGLLLLAVFVLTLRTTWMQAQLTTHERTIDRLVSALAIHHYQLRGERLRGSPVCVIIPAYQEANSIGAVLSQIPPAVCGLEVEVLVVVDGSTDDTTEISRLYNANVATQVINRGGGTALSVGFDLALQSGARFVVTMDADGQHIPAEMERLVQPLLDRRADLVIGSRVLGFYDQDEIVRAWGVVLFNRLISVLSGQRITDCSNSYRAITAAALADIRPYLVQRQYHTSELLLEALKQRQRVLEVPITVRRRLNGESKKGPTLLYAAGFLRAMLATWLR
jgi:hypothetical protein